jgi:hypothetical protein
MNIERTKTMQGTPRQDGNPGSILHKLRIRLRVINAFILMASLSNRDDTVFSGQFEK